jgi:Uma2 family endonuclease
METAIRSAARLKKNDYPTSDGRPMAETDQHRILMNDLIQTLQAFYADEPLVYVSGNLLLFYVRGDRLKHLSPDVFVVKGVPKHPRDNYLLWEEGRPPSIVIELTSSSTKDEDIHDKYALYQDSIGVFEYFLFDPFGDYLKPPFRGYRLRQGKYVPIKSMKGRLPSKSLGLHLERNGAALRLYDPATQEWLPTPLERIATAEAEIERLRRENQDLRRRQPNGRRG